MTRPAPSASVNTMMPFSAASRRISAVFCGGLEDTEAICCQNRALSDLPQSYFVVFSLYDNRSVKMQHAITSNLFAVFRRLCFLHDFHIQLSCHNIRARQSDTDAIPQVVYAFAAAQRQIFLMERKISIER